jgi:lysozyme
MISRRNVISGLAAAATTGCSAPQAPRQASVAPDQYQQTTAAQYPPAQYPIAPAPPSRATQGLDAVIDVSANTTVSDFRLKCKASDNC